MTLPDEDNVNDGGNAKKEHFTQRYRNKIDVYVFNYQYVTFNEDLLGWISMDVSRSWKQKDDGMQIDWHT